MTKRIFALFLLLITALLLFPACNQKETSRRYKRTETELFDTVCSFSCAGDKEEFDRTADLLFEELARLDALFDVYEEREGMNTLFTVNKMAGVAPVKVDPLLIDFFLYINQLPKDLTALAHPMMGAVTLLWKEGQKTGVPPGQASLDLAKNHIDPSSLIVNEEEGTLFISDPDARIDVGAFAKGYAGRLCVALLEKRQVNDYLLSL
ncbi:MAG: FAD:protein FMN transferase, partial [Clostridia bacterium]|nr:FAD:protein FMN transferase [Clostridia bacterium]